MNKYIIYGTGSIAKEHFEKIKKEQGADAVECFIDSMLSKENFCGKKVISPAELKHMDFNEYMYLLGTFTNRKSMINELLQQGVSYKNILVERDYGSNSFEDNVKNVSKILLYPDANDEVFLNNIDKQFSILVPNIVNLKNQPELVSNKTIKLKNINLISSINNMTEYDLVLVWKKENLLDERLSSVKNVYCIDPSYFTIIDTRILLRLNLALERSEDKKRYKEASEENYKKFAQVHIGSNSYVFGTGPSCRIGAEKVFEQNSIRIACNAIIDSDKLMSKIKPNIYTIADETLIDKMGIDLIEKIYQYCLNNPCIFAVPDILGAVLIQRYPKLLNKMVRITFDTNKINFPSPKDLSVYRKAYNVITLLSIPLASYLSDKIYISGCDGVSEEGILSKRVWQYESDLEKNESTNRIIEAVEKTENNWEEEYYLKHCSYFEEILTYGEQLGRVYVPYTKTYIPALKKRVN